MVTVKGRDPEGLHRLSTWRRLQQREGTSLVASTVKNLPAMTGDGFSPWVRKMPWRKEWLLTPVFLPGEFHRQRWAVLDTTKTNTFTFTILAEREEKYKPRPKGKIIQVKM